MELVFVVNMRTLTYSLQTLFWKGEWKHSQYNPRVGPRPNPIKLQIWNRMCFTQLLLGWRPLRLANSPLIRYWTRGHNHPTPDSWSFHIILNFSSFCGVSFPWTWSLIICQRGQNFTDLNKGFSSKKNIWANAHLVRPNEGVFPPVIICCCLNIEHHPAILSPMLATIQFIV